jgi:pyridinium-3,5-biscarboxylic acid mononucleotide synthase
MTAQELQALLDEVRDGRTPPGDAARRVLDAMRAAPFEDLGFARVDTHRHLRQGFPEVILGIGKTPAQIAGIAASIASRGHSLLVTRATPEAYAAVHPVVPDAVYHEAARVIVARRGEIAAGTGTVLVVCAGTSDLPVAEEAAITAEVMGNTVERLYDVGVAGLHRLLSAHQRLRAARVLIVVAGMEGALPSVVAGLVEAPVIAVPTSIGYGASFGGIAALLGMLNSCANGVAVVNIDNGFGAACMASSITHG